MKSRRARSTQKETQKWAVGERKESLQWSLINFPFHPRSLGTRQSVKTVTTIVPQIRKVTTACQGCIEFIYLLNRFRNNFPLHESNVFDKWYVFLSTGHWTSMCPLEWELNTLILVWFTFEKSSTFPDWAPCRNHQHFIFVRSWTREQRVPGLGSLMWYCSCFLPFLLSFLTVNWTPTSSSATLSRTCFWIFLPSGIQSGKETDIGRQHLNLSSLSLFSFSELNKVLDTWWRVLISLHKTATNSVRPILVSQYSIGNPSLSHVQFRKNHIKRARLLWGWKTSSQFQYNTLRTKFDTQTTVISHRRRKRFSSSAGLLIRVSSAITNRTQDLAIRASCFYISVKI